MDTRILIAGHGQTLLAAPPKDGSKARAGAGAEAHPPRCTVARVLGFAALLTIAGLLVAILVTLNRMIPTPESFNDEHGNPTAEMHVELANYSATARITATLQPLSEYHTARLESCTCQAYDTLAGNAHAATIKVDALAAATTPGRASPVELAVNATGRGSLADSVYQLDCTFVGDVSVFGAVTIKSIAFTERFAVDTRSASASLGAAGGNAEEQPDLLGLVRVMPPAVSEGGVPGAGPLVVNASASFSELARRAGASRILRAGTITIPPFAYSSHLQDAAVSESEAQWNVTFSGIAVDVVSSTADGGVFTLSAQQESHHHAFDGDAGEEQGAWEAPRRRRALGWVGDYNAGHATCLADRPGGTNASGPLTGDSSKTVHWVLPAYDMARALYTSDHATLVLTPSPGAPKLLPYKLASAHTLALNVAKDPDAYHVCFQAVFDDGVVDSELCISEKDNAFWRGSLVTTVENKTMVAGSIGLDISDGTKLTAAVDVNDLVGGADVLTIQVDVTEQAAASGASFTHDVVIRIKGESMGDDSTILVSGGGTCTHELNSLTYDQDCSTALAVQHNGAETVTLSAPDYGWAVTPSTGSYYINSLNLNVKDVGNVQLTAMASSQDTGTGYTLAGSATVVDFDGVDTVVAMSLSEKVVALQYKHTADVTFNRANDLSFALVAAGTCVKPFLRDAQECSSTATATNLENAGDADDTVLAAVTLEKYGWMLHNADKGTLFVDTATVDIPDLGQMDAGATLSWYTSSAKQGLSGNVHLKDFAANAFSGSASISETAPATTAGSYAHAVSLHLSAAGGGPDGDAAALSPVLSVAIDGTCAHHSALTVVANDKDCATAAVIATGDGTYTLDVARYGWAIGGGAGDMFVEMTGRNAEAQSPSPAASTSLAASTAEASEVGVSASLKWGGPVQDFDLTAVVDATLGETVVSIAASIDELATAGVYAHAYRFNVTAGTGASSDFKIRLAADGDCKGHAHLNLDFSNDKECSTAMKVRVGGEQIVSLDLTRYGWQFRDTAAALYLDHFALVVKDSADVAMHFAYDYASMPSHTGELAFNLDVHVLEGSSSSGNEQAAVARTRRTGSSGTSVTSSTGANVAFDLTVAAAMSFTNTTDFALDGSLVATEKEGLRIECGLELRETQTAEAFDHAMKMNLTSSDLDLDFEATANGTCTNEYFTRVQACASTAQISLDDAEIMRMDVAKYGWSIGDPTAAQVGVATPSNAFVADFKVAFADDNMPEIGMTGNMDWSETAFVKSARLRTVDLDLAPRIDADTTTIKLSGSTVGAAGHRSVAGYFNTTSAAGVVSTLQLHNFFAGQKAYSLALTGRDGARDQHMSLLTSSQWDMAMADPSHSKLWQFLEEFDWMGDLCEAGNTFSYSHKSGVHYALAAGSYAAIQLRLAGFDFDAMTDAEKVMLKDNIATAVVQHSEGAISLSDIKEVILTAMNAAGGEGSRQRLRRAADDGVSATIVLKENINTNAASQLAGTLNEAISEGVVVVEITVNGEKHSVTVTETAEATIFESGSNEREQESTSSGDDMAPEMIAGITVAAAVALVAAVAAAIMIGRSKRNSPKSADAVPVYDQPPSPPRSPTSLRKFKVHPSSGDDNEAAGIDVEANNVMIEASEATNSKATNSSSRDRIEADDAVRTDDTNAAVDDAVVGVGSNNAEGNDDPQPPINNGYGLAATRDNWTTGERGYYGAQISARPSQKINRAAKVSAANSLASLGSKMSNSAPVAEDAEN